MGAGEGFGYICAEGAARKRLVMSQRRYEGVLQANRQTKRAFLRKRRNDGACDRFFCKEKSEQSKVCSDVDNVNGLDINYKGYIRGFCVDILKYF